LSWNRRLGNASTVASGNRWAAYFARADGTLRGALCAKRAKRASVAGYVLFIAEAASTV